MKSEVKMKTMKNCFVLLILCWSVNGLLKQQHSIDVSYAANSTKGTKLAPSNSQIFESDQNPSLISTSGRRNISFVKFYEKPKNRKRFLKESDFPDKNFEDFVIHRLNKYNQNDRFLEKENSFSHIESNSPRLANYPRNSKGLLSLSEFEHLLSRLNEQSLPANYGVSNTGKSHEDFDYNHEYLIENINLRKDRGMQPKMRYKPYDENIDFVDRYTVSPSSKYSKTPNGKATRTESDRRVKDLIKSLRQKLNNKHSNERVNVYNKYIENNRKHFPNSKGRIKSGAYYEEYSDDPYDFVTKNRPATRFLRKQHKGIHINSEPKLEFRNTDINHYYPTHNIHTDFEKDESYINQHENENVGKFNHRPIVKQGNIRSSFTNAKPSNPRQRANKYRNNDEFKSIHSPELLKKMNIFRNKKNRQRTGRRGSVRTGNNRNIFPANLVKFKDFGRSEKQRKFLSDLALLLKDEEERKQKSKTQHEDVKKYSDDLLQFIRNIKNEDEQDEENYNLKLAHLSLKDTKPVPKSPDVQETTTISTKEFHKENSNIESLLNHLSGHRNNLINANTKINLDKNYGNGNGGRITDNEHHRSSLGTSADISSTTPQSSISLFTNGGTREINSAVNGLEKGKIVLNNRENKNKTLADILSSNKLNYLPKKTSFDSTTAVTPNLKIPAKSSGRNSNLNSGGNHNFNGTNLNKFKLKSLIGVTTRPVSLNNVTDKYNSASYNSGKFYLRPQQVLHHDTRMYPSGAMAIHPYNIFTDNSLQTFSKQAKISPFSKIGQRLPPHLQFLRQNGLGSPIFINSTVIVGTTPQPHLQIPIGYMPRAQTPFLLNHVNPNAAALSLSQRTPQRVILTGNRLRKRIRNRKRKQLGRNPPKNNQTSNLKPVVEIKNQPKPSQSPNPGQLTITPIPNSFSLPNSSFNSNNLNLGGFQTHSNYNLSKIRQKSIPKTNSHPKNFYFNSFSTVSPHAITPFFSATPKTRLSPVSPNPLLITGSQNPNLPFSLNNANLRRPKIHSNFSLDKIGQSPISPTINPHSQNFHFNSFSTVNPLASAKFFSTTPKTRPSPVSPNPVLITRSQRPLPNVGFVPGSFKSTSRPPLNQFPGINIPQQSISFAPFPALIPVSTFAPNNFELAFPPNHILNTGRTITYNSTPLFPTTISPGLVYHSTTPSTILGGVSHVNGISNINPVTTIHLSTIGHRNINGHSLGNLNILPLSKGVKGNAVVKVPKEEILRNANRNLTSRVHLQGQKVSAGMTKTVDVNDDVQSTSTSAPRRRKIVNKSRNSTGLKAQTLTSPPKRRRIIRRKKKRKNSQQNPVFSNEQNAAIINNHNSSPFSEKAISRKPSIDQPFMDARKRVPGSRSQFRENASLNKTNYTLSSRGIATSERTKNRNFAQPSLLRPQHNINSQGSLGTRAKHLKNARKRMKILSRPEINAIKSPAQLSRSNPLLHEYSAKTNGKTNIANVKKVSFPPYAPPLPTSSLVHQPFPPKEVNLLSNLSLNPQELPSGQYRPFSHPPPHGIYYSKLTRDNSLVPLIDNYPSNGKNTKLGSAVPSRLSSLPPFFRQNYIQNPPHYFPKNIPLPPLTNGQVPKPFYNLNEDVLNTPHGISYNDRPLGPPNFSKIHSSIPAPIRGYNGGQLPFNHPRVPSHLNLAPIISGTSGHVLRPLQHGKSLRRLRQYTAPDIS